MKSAGRRSTSTSTDRRATLAARCVWAALVLAAVAPGPRAKLDAAVENFYEAARYGGLSSAAATGASVGVAVDGACVQLDASAEEGAGFVPSLDGACNATFMDLKDGSTQGPVRLGVPGRKLTSDDTYPTFGRIFGPMFRHDSFEPIWAVFSFGLWIALWHGCDRMAAQAALQKCPTKDAPIGAYLLQHRIAGEEPPAASTTISGHWLLAVIAYLGPLLVIDGLYPRRLARLPEAALPFWSHVGELALTLFLYDAVFFFAHIGMHRGPLWLRRLHAHHHSRNPLNASETVRHSFVDGSLQVLANIAVLNGTGAHPLTRMAHNFFVTCLLTEAHASYDLPFQLHRVIPFGLYGGAPRHEAHHHRGDVYFHQFFTYLDDALGTVQPATASTTLKNPFKIGDDNTLDVSLLWLRQAVDTFAWCQAIVLVLFTLPAPRVVISTAISGTAFIGVAQVMRRLSSCLR